MSNISFRPADSFTERHGLFVALAGGTNSGKTYSALRLARGIAGPSGKIAVADTEGGRTLHLKKDFRFDVMMFDPPHRPERYAEAARAAEDAGYDVLVIDSFSMEWVGLGGVLDWQAEEFERMGSREAVKLASWIKPKMAHKSMVYSFLQRRMPIVFSMRAEEKAAKVGSNVKSEWAPICNKAFPFEVTVSFMLKQDRQGMIDLSLPHKMEGIHRGMFRDGDQLSEEHGAQLAAWARGEIHGQPSAGAGPDVAAQVFEEAAAAARQGKDAFTAWWNGPGKESAPGTETSKRVLVNPRRPELQAMVEVAENPTGPAANDDDFPGTLPGRAEG
ncbi:AAA family ATPase [Azospirillum argentinense]|uniref:AAA domain-containing protein n=1 Tax=Azospirillum argentinense TaxID=2970906 RepID=A0A5B0KYL5_9PROT|nr:AAA family ATPase [Azospirillum argentinense]KAA1057199.1 phage protein [Azospirillum argentinense]